MNQEMREELDSILSKAEYQAYYQDNRSLLQRLWDSFRDWLLEILSYFDINLEPSSQVANIVVLTIVFIIAILLLVLVLFLIKRIIKRRALKSKNIFLSDEADWTYQQHMDEAIRYQSEQQFELATRHTFLAFLLFLQEYDLLEIKRWKTNWEYANELASNEPTLVSKYQTTAHFFEKVTYGDEPVSEGQFQQYFENIKHWMDEWKSTRKAGDEE